MRRRDQDSYALRTRTRCPTLPSGHWGMRGGRLRKLRVTPLDADLETLNIALETSTPPFAVSLKA